MIQGKSAVADVTGVPPENSRWSALRRVDPATAALTILALVVASLHLGDKSLWLDEVASAHFTSDLGLLGDMVSGRDPNMALYYGLLYLWREPFGSGEVALRSLTVVLGAMTVPFMVLLATEMFGRATGLVSGLLLALSPFFVQYEQTARSYAVVVLLVVLSSYFFVRELKRPSRATRVGFVLTSALAIYAQYLAALVLLVQLLTLLASERRAAFTRKWLLDAGAIAVLCAPEVVFALRKGTAGISWVPPPTLGDLIDVPAELAGGRFLLLTLLILACFGFFRAIREGRLRFAGFVAAWFLAPLLLVYGVSELGRPLFLPQYVIIAVPPLLLLASAGLVRLPRRALGAVALGALIAASAVGISDWYRKPSKENFRDATAYILENARPGDGIRYSPIYIAAAFDYYATRAGEPLPSPAAPGATPPRIWLAVRFGDPPPEVSQSLAGGYVPVADASRTFPTPSVMLYTAKPQGPTGTASGDSTGTERGGPGETRPAADLSDANLRASDLPPGWRLAPTPPDSLAQHLFACLDRLGPDQPASAVSAAGPGSLNVISDVLTWPAASDAQSGAAAFAPSSGNAESCVASSLHFVTGDFRVHSSGDTGVEVDRRPPASPQVGRGQGSAGPSVAPGAGAPTYELRYRGPGDATGGVLMVVTRGHATAVVLAYRTGERPLRGAFLRGLYASTHRRLGGTGPPAG